MYQQRNKESNVSTPEIQATKADGRIDESAVLAIYSSIDSACLQDIAKALQDRGEEMAAISKQFTIFLKNICICIYITKSSADKCLHSIRNEAE